MKGLGYFDELIVKKKFWFAFLASIFLIFYVVFMLEELYNPLYVFLGLLSYPAAALIQQYYGLVSEAVELTFQIIFWIGTVLFIFIPKKIPCRVRRVIAIAIIIILLLGIPSCFVYDAGW